MRPFYLLNPNGEARLTEEQKIALARERCVRELREMHERFGEAVLTACCLDYMDAVQVNARLSASVVGALSGTIQMHPPEHEIKAVQKEAESIGNRLRQFAIHLATDVRYVRRHPLTHDDMYVDELHEWAGRYGDPILPLSIAAYLVSCDTSPITCFADSNVNERANYVYTALLGALRARYDHRDEPPKDTV